MSICKTILWWHWTRFNLSSILLESQTRHHPCDIRILCLLWQVWGLASLMDKYFLFYCIPLSIFQFHIGGLLPNQFHHYQAWIQSKHIFHHPDGERHLLQVHNDHDNRIYLHWKQRSKLSNPLCIGIQRQNQKICMEPFGRRTHCCDCYWWIYELPFPSTTNGILWSNSRTPPF